jgi:hypothetical protein
MATLFGLGAGLKLLAELGRDGVVDVGNGIYKTVEEVIKIGWRQQCHATRVALL